jgi:hypothetical protein
LVFYAAWWRECGFEGPIRSALAIEITRQINRRRFTGPNPIPQARAAGQIDTKETKMRVKSLICHTAGTPLGRPDS